MSASSCFWVGRRGEWAPFVELGKRGWLPRRLRAVAKANEERLPPSQSQCAAHQLESPNLCFNALRKNEHRTSRKRRRGRFTEGRRAGRRPLRSGTQGASWHAGPGAALLHDTGRVRHSTVLFSNEPHRNQTDCADCLHPPTAQPTCAALRASTVLYCRNRAAAGAKRPPAPFPHDGASGRCAKTDSTYSTVL